MLAGAFSLTWAQPDVDSTPVETPAATANDDATGTMPSPEAAPPPASAAPDFVSPTPTSDLSGAPTPVLVIPVDGPIASPNLFVLRRGLKEAIDDGVGIVVIELNTPGGSVATMMEMVEAIHRFDGRVIAYINQDAISAGAYLAMVCDEVWFHPDGAIGAAAMVSGTGEDVPETMRLKLESFLGARMRAYLRHDPYRADLLRAMSQADFVLELDGEVIKPEGELLTLTADEATKTYGDPARPLLAAGTAVDLNSLLDQLTGGKAVASRVLEVTWAEQVAKFMNMIAPVLLGIAFLLISIEFKTPGWGIFGTLGITLLVTVFLSNYVAGLAGYEPLLLCGLGLLLVLIELFILPGIGILLITGMVMIGISVVWSLADLWPGVAPDGRPGVSLESFGSPILDLLLAMVVFGIGLVLVVRFLPKTTLFNRLVLAGAVAPADPVASGGGLGGASALPALGALGVAVTALRPTGEIEVDGQRFEATVGFGSLARGDRVIVTAYRNLTLEVARAPNSSAPTP